MRGKGPVTADHFFLGGITPAYAGKSRSPRGLRPRSGDHPRVCGEKLLVQLPDNRQRGKAGRRHGAAKPHGIIPACAGKSSQRSSATRSARDHPRVCGEKSGVDSRIEVLEGSPPRMRGKAGQVVNPGGCCRITPACAGKSFFFNSSSLLERDHPRVCGEKGWIVLFLIFGMGSPPRMRGKA